ncbi:MAG TPA: hypothetical protein VMU40_08705 [Steroidobacteraceae bacterium]|nr:hypothetical protein [Steroidobacteraceae bacterium]
MQSLIRAAALALSGALCSFGAAAAQAQPAHWVHKKLYFVYVGFTTRYSCEGLADDVRAILLQLGARRSDLNVHQVGCTSALGSPDPYPAVGGTFSVLEPLLVARGPASEGSGPGSPVAAHWQRVRIKLDGNGIDTTAQCELIEQVRRKILPLFPAREVEFAADCVPYQIRLDAVRLAAQVLVPDHSRE